MDNIVINCGEPSLQTFRLHHALLINITHCWSSNYRHRWHNFRLGSQTSCKFLFLPTMEVDSVEVIEHVHVHETVVEHVHVHETVTESHTFEMEVTQVNGHDDKPESESEDGEAESSLQRSDSEDSLYASTTGTYEIMPESEGSAVPCGKSSDSKLWLLNIKEKFSANILGHFRIPFIIYFCNIHCCWVCCVVLVKHVMITSRW